MKKQLILVLSLCLLPLFIFAQSANKLGTISGILLSETSEPIPYATVSVFDVEEQFVAGAISDEKGFFEVAALPLATCMIEIKSLGYKTKKAGMDLNKKNRKVDIGQVTMELDQQQLDAVEITGEQSSYNLRLDKKVFQVGKDILSQGGNAIDVLEQVPLVSVDPNGTVMLRGSSQVQILINGKRSGLTMNNALEQIGSENIERVEVLTNPSASFDASGSAGIINIILKKKRKEGLNGQISVVAGIPANHIVMPGFNYRKGKLNLFGNYRWRYSDYNGNYSMKQETYNDGVTTFLNQVEDEDRHDDGRSGYYGGDYYFSDKSSVTLAYYRSKTKDTDVTQLDYRIWDNDTSDFNISRIGNSVENRAYNQLESNFTHHFDDKGQKLNLDFQYDFWNSTKDWELDTEGDVKAVNTGKALRTTNKAGSKDYVLKGDWIKPLTKDSKVEMGVKLENRIVTNDYLAEIEQDEQWITYNDIDNELDYSEKIGAAYIQYQNRFKKWEYQLGLRSEYTLIDIADVEEAYSDQKKYINLFPSVHLSYPMNDQNSLQLSYSRRINRPSLWSLYPFNEIKDFNFQQIGNPSLNPSFTNSYELSLLHASEKISINPSVFWKQTNDPTQDYLERTADGMFLTKPVNLDTRNEVGASVSINYSPVRMLRLSAEMNALRFQERGEFETQNMDIDGTNWGFRLISSMRLPLNLKWQAMFAYQGPEQSAQINYLDVYTLNSGLSTTFLDDNLMVSLRGFNILNSRVQRADAESPTFKAEQEGARYGARYSLGIVYKINQTPKDRIREAKRGNR